MIQSRRENDFFGRGSKSACSGVKSDYFPDTLNRTQIVNPEETKEHAKIVKRTK